MIEHDLHSPAGAPITLTGQPEAQVALGRAIEWAARAQVALSGADGLAALQTARCAGKAVDDALAALPAIVGARR